MRRAALVLAGMALALALALPVAGQAARVEALEHPVVVVTSVSRAGGDGPPTCGPPCRPFSALARVTNDASEMRTYGLWLDAHVEPSIGDCSIERTTPLHFFGKTVRVAPGASFEAGGSADPRSGAAYWPSAIYERYAGPEGEIATEEGPHTFCIHLIDMTPGTSETCAAPCVRATDRFEAYVRTSNEPPAASFSWRPERPTPGVDVQFEARLADNDTVPRPDTVTARWAFGAAGTAEGTRATITFGFADTYHVVLTVTDGFDSVRRHANVTVVSPADDGPSGRVGQPVPSIGAVVSAVAAAWLRRRTR